VSSAAEFVVVCPQIVGSAGDWETVYYVDPPRHGSRAAAIRTGIRQHDHDDFLLAVIVGDQVIGVAWQYEDKYYEDEPEEVEAIARELGLKANRQKPPYPGAKS